MTRIRYCVTLFAVAALAGAEPWDDVKVQINVRVPMQDGVKLSGRCVPPRLGGQGPWASVAHVLG